MNMRRILKTPANCLRMADGGEVSAWSLKGIAKKLTAPSAPPMSMTEKFARQDAARGAPAAPAPVAAAPAPAPTQGISGYVGNGALEGRMKAAGLRDGGTVPGKGQGDKIPALYEPGEFVVSNDMLDAAPGLRDELHTLRGHVLHAKGKTVAEANAQATNGATLRAKDGIYDPATKTWTPTAQPVPQPIPTAEPAGRSLMARPNFVMGDNSAPSASSSTSLRARDTNWTYGAPETAQPRPMSSALVPTGDPGSNGARPNFTFGDNSKPMFTDPAAGETLHRGGPQMGVPRGASTPASMAAEAARGSDMRPMPRTLRGTVGGLGNAVATAGPGLAAGYLTGLAGAGAVHATKNLGNPDNTPAGPAQPQGLESQIPTDGYNPAPKKQPYNFFTDNETGRNLGNLAIAGSAALGPGGLPLLAGAGRTLRMADVAGNLGIAANQGAAAALMDVRGPQSVPKAPAPTATAAAPGTFSAGDATMPAQEQIPGRVRVDRQANGNLAFSGTDVSGPVSYQGPGSNALPGLRDPGKTYNVMPGMSKAQTDAILTNPDGSRWTAQDEATARANLRDGIDQYRGTSRDARNDKDAELKRLALSEAGTPGRKAALALLTQQMQNDTTMYGHNVTERDNIRTNNTSRTNNELTNDTQRTRLRYDMSKDERDYKRNVANDDFTQGQAAQKAIHEELASYIPPGADGKPDMARAAQLAVGLNAHLSARASALEKHLQLNPNDKQAASELEGLRKRGPAMMDATAKRKFITGVMAQDAARAAATPWYNPVGALVSDDQVPYTSLRRKDGLLGHDYVANNGDEIPGRFIDRSGSWLGIGGRPNQNFKDLIVRNKE